MNKMVLAAVSVVVLSFSAHAETGKDISAKKAKLVEKITKRIDCMNKRIPFLQEFKACVEGASDRAGIKKCRKDNKEKTKGLKENCMPMNK